MDLLKLAERLPQARDPKLIMRILRLFHKFGPLYYATFALIALKIIAELALDSEHLAQYRWLDCYLLGRFQISTRIPDASKYIAVVTIIYQALTRLYVNRMGGILKISFLEFVMLPHAVVERQHGAIVARAGHRQRRATSCEQLDPEEVEVEPKGQSLDSLSLDKLVGFWGPVGSCRYILRPNRRPESHVTLASVAAFVFLASCVLFGTIVSIELAMLAPVTLTQMGFRRAYANCARWISGETRAQQARDSSYDFIFRAGAQHRLPNSKDDNEEVPIFLPLVDLQPVNLYQFLRVLADLLENFLCYAEMIITYQVHTILLVTIVVDVLIYNRSICEKLHLLLDHLERDFPCGNSGIDKNVCDDVHELEDRHRAHLDPLLHRGSTVSFLSAKVQARQRYASELANLTKLARASDGDKASGARKVSGAQQQQNYNAPTNECHEQVTEIQALVQDYFSLIGKYNKYVSLITSIDTFIVVLFTWNIFVRRILPDRLRAVSALDQGVQGEFYIMCSMSVSLGVFILSVVSVVESRSRQLYQLLASSMALDQDSAGTKMRWLQLMCYYHPRRLHCFSLFNQVSLCWLLMLKLVFWLVSSLIVVSSLT